MTALVPFAFEDHLFRALDRGGEPWFVASDVAKILGYAEAKDMTRTLDEDEKGRHSVPTLGGVQGVWIISEPGLYRAILQRRVVKSLSAEVQALIARFQRWVFHDLLPTLRRTGAYAMPGVQIPTDREQNQDTEYRRRLDTVSEARRLYGSARAQLLYEKLGLPEVPDLPDPPPAEIPAALASGPLVTAIVTLLEASPSGVWQGTPTAFLKALSAPGIAPEHARASPHWPAFPKTLSVAIKRITPALNALGVEIVRRHSQVTTWTLRLLREPATTAAAGSAPEGKAFH